MEIENLPSYYMILFNAVTDAITALDRQDFGQARDILVRSRRPPRTPTSRQRDKKERGRGRVGPRPRGVVMHHFPLKKSVDSAALGGATSDSCHW